MILDKITDHEVFLHMAICAKHEVPFTMCYIIIVLGSFNLCFQMVNSIKNVSSSSSRMCICEHFCPIHLYLSEHSLWFTCFCMDFPLYKWIHAASSIFAQIQINSLGFLEICPDCLDQTRFARIQMDCLRYAQIHPDSPRFTQTLPDLSILQSSVLLALAG